MQHLLSYLLGEEKLALPDVHTHPHVRYLTVCDFFCGQHVLRSRVCAVELEFSGEDRHLRLFTLQVNAVLNVWVTTAAALS